MISSSQDTNDWFLAFCRYQSEDPFGHSVHASSKLGIANGSNRAVLEWIRRPRMLWTVLSPKVDHYCRLSVKSTFRQSIRIGKFSDPSSGGGVKVFEDAP
jgi:hypothetical protein